MNTSSHAPRDRSALVTSNHRTGSLRRWPVRCSPLVATIFFSLFLRPALALNLTSAVVLTPPGLSAREEKAIDLLRDEVRHRTRVRLHRQLVGSWTNASFIAVGPMTAWKELAGPFADQLPPPPERLPPEGFSIHTVHRPGQAGVFVFGNDARGVLYGVGRLLRELRMRRDRFDLPTPWNLVTAPRYRLRGHQLGYRPKTNSYDAWDLATWEQYFRDLIVFGCNAVELIPPRSDDAADSPHFPLPQIDMMAGMSHLADEYGLDVWVWYPAMDADYTKPKTVNFALHEWGEVFRRLPRLDAVFVPGGDPGHTEPKVLLALLEKETKVLHRYHPRAQMWVSPQSFDQAWLREFLDILRTQKPAWLSGVVYGPQMRMSIREFRRALPQQYPIRHYPDITHSRQCQFPVPDWDTAFAVTEGRECVNPRPTQEAAIFHLTEPSTIGFITYSEGCKDDVNKTIWSALGWDPRTPVLEILRQYSRYFIGPDEADDFAQGLLALERDWHGPIAANPGIETTYGQFRSLERRASPALLHNWRFLQTLYRADYDAYIRRRLVHETDLENEALDELRAASALGAKRAMTQAAARLDQALTHPVSRALRLRLFQLAEALFQKIGMQLSVPRYDAIATDRGASLDTVDFPLNDRIWLEHQFQTIRRLPSETQRLAALRKIVNWTNPGPGGFYDDLGRPEHEPHLVRGLPYARDPGFLRSPFDGFEEEWNSHTGPRRFSWIDHAETLYETPLTLRYTGLDPHAAYTVRVVYAGDSLEKPVRLVANQNTEIHPYLKKPVPFRPLEFPIPHAATASGTLTLRWFGKPGLGHNGRGCQVSEVWLVKREAVNGPALDGRN